MTGPIRFLQGERGGSYGRGFVILKQETKARGYQKETFWTKEHMSSHCYLFLYSLYLASSFQILDCFPDRLVKYVPWMSETFHVACLVMICFPSQCEVMRLKVCPQKINSGGKNKWLERIDCISSVGKWRYGRCTTTRAVLKCRRSKGYKMKTKQDVSLEMQEPYF